jgi:acyl-CoA reductase-like NAD-dependent aldehyde dehydrogenase
MNNDTVNSSLDRTVQAAVNASVTWEATDAATRGRTLRAIASALEANVDALVAVGHEETHLGEPRLRGELARTAFQLRGFASQVEMGTASVRLVEEPIPGAPPESRPRLVKVRVPVGPVAVFAASNFPLAFSVLGGDTASALAAGCAVVVKAHPSHPRLSRMTHEIAVAAIRAQGLDASVLGLVASESLESGVALVRHPGISAVAFTGSVHGGLALEQHARQRERPIPFYGELGSVNPVVVMPEALDGNETELARSLAASMTAGTGQFCTSPGVVMVFRAAKGTAPFVAKLAASLASQSTHEMLNAGIRHNFDRGVARMLNCSGIEVVAGESTPAVLPPRPVMVKVSAESFLAQPLLREEVFGPASVLVEVESAEDVIAVLGAIGGTLTTTIWGANESTTSARAIVKSALRVSGRVIFSGVPTGVAVTGAQHHGGPYPSSTAPFTTSVGYAAMDRFLRPLALQDAPAWLEESLELEASEGGPAMEVVRRYFQADGSLILSGRIVYPAERFSVSMRFRKSQGNGMPR